MITMDLKGITWVGHVYQKFETMCLEVEDIMYQDTVKYVENQVQTVGASVKKFYSDVMQDILPPSSMDLVKGDAASNMIAEKHHDVGIYKKPKIAMKEGAVKVDNKPLTDDSQVTADMDKDASHGDSFHGFLIEDTSFHSSSGNNVSGACSDLCSNLYKNRSMHDKLSLGVTKISREENLRPSETSGAITLTGKDTSRISSFYELDKNHEPSCDQIALRPTPVTLQSTGSNSGEEIWDEFESEEKGTPDVLTDSPSYEDCNETENRSAHSSCNGQSANAADICMNNGVVSVMGSSADGDVQPNKFSDKGIIVCHSGGQSEDSSTDTVQSSSVVEQESEAIEPVENFKVEETCVLVNEDELHFVPHKEGKYKPYKKKIRDAITSRMRSARKQEYKQLAVRYVEDVKSNQGQAGSSMPTKLVEGTERSPSPDICEFEWELL
ncbi:hypothetical protein Ddye_004436 [Dipteronia dyeriana]|uniref:Uncharacterized protein n=1 Tax=Dipteronia dyeriana TaxID=168575 RepID=A0AAE0CW85_9ROSI|nr:hypothetical protein Ddye_004436 [Dipteronia dyeriana]